LNERLSTDDLVAVYIVTFRRNEMFRRALRSVLGQTHRNIVVRVVNDDPADEAVENIVREANDSRARMYYPMRKRGATENFNLVFTEEEARFASLLEDDNWWEPDFISTMVDILKKRPDDFIVVGNERLWKEQSDRSWEDTGRTIWDIRGVERFRYSLPFICGHAKLCNSSLLVRLGGPVELFTPSTIPVDVTEHFRERLLSDTILLCGTPLVNYAETLHSARGGGQRWGNYQIILIGSAFIALQTDKERDALARMLWSECDTFTGPRAVSLAATGCAIPEARALLKRAPVSAKLRMFAWIARRPGRLAEILRINSALADELKFLADAPLTKKLASSFGSNA